VQSSIPADCLVDPLAHISLKKSYPRYRQFGNLILIKAWFRGLATPEDSELAGNAIRRRIQLSKNVPSKSLQRKTLCLPLLAPA